MSYFWELIQFDGTRLEIPPEGVEVVKRRWDNGDPIHTSAMTIPANQIKTFRQTSKVFTTQPLMEAAAQAFREPMYDKDGSVQAKWVKKPVTNSDYAKHYSAVPAYKKLDGDSGMVTVAFRLATHDVDLNKVDYCTDEEIQRLTRG